MRLEPDFLMQSPPVKIKGPEVQQDELVAEAFTALWCLGSCLGQTYRNLDIWE